MFHMHDDDIHCNPVIAHFVLYKSKFSASKIM